MTARKSFSPPRPRQVVQVGVTGHRPNRISAAAAAGLPRQCAQVLSAIAQLATKMRDAQMYAPGEPLLRVISPLAEGADRMVAEAGLSMGADLQCPLPFDAGEYSRDFAGDASRQEFRALLSKASAVFEADGRRGADETAYERAGRMVIEQSDFLIAIWDGEPAAGRGGTPQIIDEAMAQKVPIIWLHASESVEPRILHLDESGNRQLRPLEDLAPLFARRQDDASSGHEKPFDLSRAYFAEAQPRWNGGCLYTFFRDLIAKGKLRLGALRVADFESSARADWGAAFARIPDLPEATRVYLLDKLCPHYAWADGLSVYYAGLSRSGSVATNLLSALAVFFALAGPFFHMGELRHDRPFLFWLNRAPSLIEFALIAAILLVTYYGRRQHWHARWLNYRQLAERLRQYSYVAPLGCWLPAPPRPAHLGSDPGGSWVDGAFRAIARDAGLAPGTVNASYVDSIGQMIGDILDGQIRFHAANHRTMDKLSHRLHRAGTMLFAITLLACVVHVMMGGEASWLLMLAAAPPAFGAAFYAITNQGEFARSGDRSHAMARELASLKDNELRTALASGEESFDRLRSAAQRIAETMISETVDWNFVFRYRQLNLPG